ncbi:MAG: DUF3108 domain-containing protein [Terrimonas sp.]|nr:DUF3108 domain-containing protein [Terrimonas sp.]
MKGIKIILGLVFCVFLFSFESDAPANDNQCGIRNTAFKSGEEATFTVFYAVAGLYVNAGTAIFSNTLETLNNRPVYHIIGDGKTNNSYDWIYKVRDKYESYVDTATMQPLRFVRNVNEGGFKKYENISFNRNANSAVTSQGVFKVPDCVQDVLSSVYYARSIDFNQFQPEDKITFPMFLDNEVFNMYIRYLGKEEIRTKYGRFRAIKFKPLLLEGTIFKGGETMTVWVSDDQNHIPLRIESPIVVGKVKIDLMGYKNLRYPLSSLIRRK